MMKLDDLKNRFTIWIPIDKFPIFRELENECKKYYQNTLIFCFASANRHIYTIEFKYNTYIDKKNPGLPGFDLTFGYFKYTKDPKDIFDSFIEESHRDFWFFDKHLKKYRFTQKLNENFAKYKINFDDELKYFCHVSKLAQLITDSIP